MLEHLLPRDLVRATVAPIDVDPPNHPLRLAFGEELVPVWEIYDEEPGEDAEGDGEEAFDEEDVAPGVEDAGGGDVGESVAEDLGEPSNRHTHKVEQRHPLLRLPSSVPRRDDKHTSGEKRALEETKDDPQSQHLDPVLGDAHEGHDHTP